MLASFIEDFLVGIITSVVTAASVWGWGKIRESRNLNRKASFFGIQPKKPCLVVMNHYPESRDTMSHGDIETLIEVVRLVDSIGGKLVLEPFDKISTPAGEMTEFCIGGQDSNQRTKVHAENFLKGIYFHPYLPDDIDNIAISTSEDKFRYEKREKEYAVLARIYPSPNSRPVILIWGQTATANKGAVYYLVQNYDTSLRNKFGNQEAFCLIVQVQSTLTYGYKSVRLVKDITGIAFTSFLHSSSNSVIED